MSVIQEFTTFPPELIGEQTDLTLQLSGDIAATGGQSPNAVGLRLKLAGDMTGISKFVLQVPPPFLDEIDENAFENQIYTARLLDEAGNEILIENASIDQPKGEIGQRISISPGKKDLSLISPDNLFTFQIGRWSNLTDALDGDDPDWETIAADARISTRSFTVGKQNNLPADSLVFDFSETNKNKLNYFPPRNYILYDNLRTEAAANESEKIYTSDASYIKTTVSAFPNLTFYKILNFIKEKCGYSAVQTNIPNFPVIRADFPFDKSYRATLTGLCGNYEPVFSLVEGNVLRVQTKFADLPTTFAPVSLTIYDYSQLDLQIPASAHVDGVSITFLDSDFGANDFYDLIEPAEIIPHGEFGDADYSETRVVRTYRYWTDSANPDEILDKKLVREVHTTHDALEYLTDRETTDYEYDAQAKQTGMTQTIESTVPDLAATPPSAVLLETRNIIQKIIYAPDPRQPRRQFLNKRITQVRGLIAIDSENQALGKSGELEDYKNDFEKVYEHGNLAAAMTSEFGPIETITDTLTPIGNGQYRMRTEIRNEILGKSKFRSSEAVVGDAGINAVGGKSRRFVLWADGVSETARTGGEIIELSGGEIPLKFLKILARLILMRRTGGFQDGTLVVPGYHKSLQRGVFFRIFDRDGNSFGRFIAEGVRSNFENLGTARRQRVMTTLSISEV